MTNPLSLEECASVTKLAGHDLNNLIAESQQKIILIKCALDYDEPLDKADLMQSINLHMVLGALSDSINYLGKFQGKRIKFDMSRSDLYTPLSCISKIFDNNEVSVNIDIDYAPIISNSDLLVSAYFNLAKNAARVCKQGKHEILLSAKEFEGNLENLVYQNHEISTEGKFVKFGVSDNGLGFVQSIPFSKYLEKKDVNQNNGFGLYFVGLVCKYLGAHLSINSKPGNTEVAIYQSSNK